MYSYGPPHMAKQKQDDQLELTYSSYVKTQDVTLKTCRRWWMIGRSGERWSGISVLEARHDDDDIYHHHHIALVARMSLTLSRHSSLSFIALGRSSGQHPVSSHSCWMYVQAGRPAFARPCVGIHKSTSLMSSSLLLQQCPACLVRLTWIKSLTEKINVRFIWSIKTREKKSIEERCLWINFHFPRNALRIVFVLFGCYARQKRRGSTVALKI